MSKKLTFVSAKKGEDLSKYKEILIQVYLNITAPEIEEYITAALDKNFPILTNWIGDKGKRFIKILDDEKKVGCVTLEALDDTETHIALHHSALLPGYIAAYQQCFDCVKNEFPNAKAVSTSCSSKLPLLQAKIKALGFKKDDSYKLNEEISEGMEVTDLIGYTKNLDE